MFFDGNFKKKRTINFSQASTDKSTLLRDLHQKRFEREFEKTKVSAAISIQKCYRGYRVRQACKRSWILEVLNIKSSPAPDIWYTTRLLTFGYSRVTPPEILLDHVNLLMNFWTKPLFSDNHDSVLRWMALLSKFVAIVCTVPSHEFTPFLILIMSHDKYPHIYQTFRKKISNIILSSEYMNYLNSHLFNSNPTTNLMELTSLLLKSDDSDIYCKSILQLISTPFYQFRHVPTLHNSVNWTIVLRSISSISLTTEQSLHILINLIQTVKLDRVDYRSTDFINTIHFLLSLIPSSVFKHFQKPDFDDEDDFEDSDRIESKLEIADSDLELLLWMVSNEFLTNLARESSLTSFRIVHQLVVRFSAKKIQIIASLLFRSNLRFLASLCKSVLELPHELPQLTIPENLSLVALFSETVTVFILTLGANEKLPSEFNKDHFLSFGNLLKLIAIHLWTNNIPLHRDAITKCIKLMCNKDLRSSISPPDFWHVQRSWGNLRHNPDDGEKSSDARILRNLPFLIPFLTRVDLLRFYTRNHTENDWNSMKNIRIRRDHVFDDAFSALYQTNMKARFKVTFIDSYGMEEEGIDGGGVFKEFLTSFFRIVFDEKYGFFKSTQGAAIYPSNLEKQPHYFEFIGAMVAKALHDNILVSARFASFFLQTILGDQSQLDDLYDLDQDLYTGLLYLKSCSEAELSDMSLNFTVTENDLGVPKTIELMPNGSNIPVTKQNCIHYIALMSRYKLVYSFKLQADAFLKGFYQVIEKEWMFFSWKELSVLISGERKNIDLNDLRSNMVYSGEYDMSHPTIQLLWTVIEELDEEDMRKFVKFVTSCESPPLLGFGELHPKFCVRPGDSDVNRLRKFHSFDVYEQLLLRLA